MFRTADGPSVYLQPGPSLIHARMVAAINGVAGDFVEGHRLDEKTRGKIPKALVGKLLSSTEANKLLRDLARA